MNIEVEEDLNLSPVPASFSTCQKGVCPSLVAALLLFCLCRGVKNKAVTDD